MSKMRGHTHTHTHRTPISKPLRSPLQQYRFRYVFVFTDAARCHSVRKIISFKYTNTLTSTYTNIPFAHTERWILYFFGTTCLTGLLGVNCNVWMYKSLRVKTVARCQVTANTPYSSRLQLAGDTTLFVPILTPHLSHSHVNGMFCNLLSRFIDSLHKTGFNKNKLSKMFVPSMTALVYLFCFCDEEKVSFSLLWLYLTILENFLVTFRP